MRVRPNGWVGQAPWKQLAMPDCLQESGGPWPKRLLLGSSSSPGIALHACRFLVDHWLKSLLLESSSVSAEEMLSPESVPRLPSWFVAHKTGLPRLPFLVVLNNELRLHPSLEGMETITPDKDQLNSLGALMAVTLRLLAVRLVGLCVSCDGLLQQAPRRQGVPAPACAISSLSPINLMRSMQLAAGPTTLLQPGAVAHAWLPAPCTLQLYTCSVDESGRPVLGSRWHNVQTKEHS